MSEWIGKMLGKVRIDSLLARGGIAEVYLGEHTTLQRQVAVKILRNQYEDDPDLLNRFEREARVVAKLRHPNIVQVFDFDAVESHPYLVMEFIPGVSLSRYLHTLHGRNGRLELPVVSRIITQVAGALQYAHESGIIHRDVKPGNILITSRTSKVMAGKPLPGDFEPILTDFGLVRFLNSSRQTTTGQIAGTPAYMSPEQARGEPTDERTDVYSLGIVLYELLTGHVPFDGETTMSIIIKHVTEPPPPIPGLPGELQDVLNRALAKKADERFQTPTDLADAFNALVKDTTDAETIMDSDPKVATHITKVGYRARPQRNRKFAVLAGIAVLLLGAIFISRNYSSPPVKPTESSPTYQLPITGSTTSTVTATEKPPSPSSSPIGILHFQDGTAILDDAVLTSLAMPVPPQGSHYEIWLAGGGERYSLGTFIPSLDGKGQLVGGGETRDNLLALYDQVDVTVELSTRPDPAPSGLLTYSFTLPADGLTYLRYLLVSSPDAPDNIATFQGLIATARLIEQNAKELQSAFQRGDYYSMRRNAEVVLNLLAGSQSDTHRDWNGDGQINDPGDGFGLLLNGDRLGYIQTVYAQTDYTVSSAGATEYMIQHGEEVKTCTQNLARWTPQLRNLVQTILTSTTETDLSQPILDSVQLADHLLNGIDFDKDGTIEPIPGECGIISAYEYASSMADMPLLPINLTGTPTVTATSTTTATPAGGSGDPRNTPVPNPTQKIPSGKPPTKTPKK